MPLDCSESSSSFITYADSSFFCSFNYEMSLGRSNMLALLNLVTALILFIFKLGLGFVSDLGSTALTDTLREGFFTLLLN